MNESDTRLHKIDPQLKAAGWGVLDGSRITTEYTFTKGKISQTQKGKPKRADYVLIYKGVKLAIVEAKSDELSYAEGVDQAKQYADMLSIRFTYATNGNQIWEMDRKTMEEHFIAAYPSPEELWARTYGDVDEWRDKFNAQPYYDNGVKQPRYYQETAVRKVLEGIAKGEKRILLTLATGTGKTFIAFQIAYKLFETRWNLRKTNTRPKILFLADRNVLANQAKNDFGGFKDDAMVRIKPGSVAKNGQVPTNGSVFFTIFQTFMCGPDDSPYFGQYPKDFFDLIIIDECHRGGAKDESNWRGILEYFEPAVQLGLTATPRVDQNVNTYTYFTYHAYEYSLKQGIEDGFLTPFRHINMQSNIDDYIYSPEDEIVSGVVQQGKVYTEEDFYKGNIKIRQRDEARVKEFLAGIGETEKTLVFCATQAHAAEVRDMINAERKKKGYCQRVTANDGAAGEEYLSDFQDNEKTIPTVLTTSEKLSTGVDARNVRHIVLMRPVNSMIEFKQIIGRGTRIYDGKYYFTIWDFVHAYEKYAQPDWDGEPVCPKCGNNPCTCVVKPRGHRDDVAPTWTAHDDRPEPTPDDPNEKLEIVLPDHRVRRIKFINNIMFWGADGKPVSAQKFIEEMFGRLPDFFQSSADLHKMWADPETREALLDKMNEAGYGKDILCDIRKLIDAENCDLLDVLEYIAYATTPIERKERAQRLTGYTNNLGDAQKQFIEYMINAYVQSGIDELRMDKLKTLLELKFGSVGEGITALGGVPNARQTFKDFQYHLYA
ncbi:type I restriction enzyme, R subunit [Xylanibacter ruminicola]|uniref:EcoAI/FtnUII family type I restriction enzme subunit R n=1 Tax=Xylanibacter ruminicola TaxID=839 RepID=UPI0008E118D4|nr:DEAD/DEAH box helicase family protein [Xylanibacter ruminicola]SFC81419.1 type I restriction enzyme, R subunit [Xylanibacter ruminicola]